MTNQSWRQAWALLGPLLPIALGLAMFVGSATALIWKLLWT